MKTPSPVLEALARRYRRRQAGRTGEAGKDVSFGIAELLKDAKATEGDAHELALKQLREAEQSGILKLILLDKRDPSSFERISFSKASEAKLYERLDDFSPSQLRATLAEQFINAASVITLLRWQNAWKGWCEQKAGMAMAGKSIEFFDRSPSGENARLLALLPQLLLWEGESLVRFASCKLCGHSKELQALAVVEDKGPHAGKLRGKLGHLLEEITGGQICTLNDLGILLNPRSALVAGPLRLQLDGTWLDLGLLHGSFRISLQDFQRADKIETSAKRCLTVENETSFHELAKLRSGDLLVQTSYPGSGTLELLRQLPGTMEFWHFGDSDQAGFEILRVLREKSGLNFRPLHMQVGRIPFEQESLGRPVLPGWPFYII